MKSLSLIIVILTVSLNSFSQVPENMIDNISETQSYLVDIINDYRAELGISPLSLDTNYSKACAYHSRYMALYNVASHSQIEYKFKQYHKNSPSSQDRIKLYTRNWCSGKCGENVTLISSSTCYEDHDLSKWMDLWNKSIESGSPNYEYAAQCILWAWKDSPGHNRLLLDPDMNRAGASIHIWITEDGKIKIAGVFVATC
jgi:uncharacterized protein YkwD